MASKVVSSGSTLTISPGQTSGYIGVLPGGTLDVLSGATVSLTALQGTENLLGTDSLGVVTGGGALTVTSGGTATAGIVGSGGSETVSYGGIVSGGTVSSGGTVTVMSGGMVLAGVIGISGSDIVSSGGLVSGAVVSTGGTQTVLAGGVVSGGVVAGSAVSGVTGYLYPAELISGGQSIALTVGSGGALTIEGVTSTTQSGTTSSSAVLATGSANNTIVSGGGGVVVELGGATTGTVLLSAITTFEYGEVIDTSGPADEAIHGGTAIGTTVNYDAREYIFSGTTTGTILSGGAQFIGSSSFALNDVNVADGTVNDDGTLAFTEASGATNNFAGLELGVQGDGTLVQSGPGTLIIQDPSYFTGSVIIAAGTLELTGRVGEPGTATIDFLRGGAGTLRLDSGTRPAEAIGGFTTGEVIDLAGLTFSGATTPIVGGLGGNTVSVTEGSVTETLTVLGASEDSFVLASDRAGGTQLTTIVPLPVVSSGQTLTISSGETSSYVTVLSGGALDVLSGGAVYNTTLLGTEVLQGTDYNVAVSSGGSLTVSSGGLAEFGTVGSSGTMTVLSGGASAEDVGGSGSVTVSSGGTTLNDTLSSGGSETVLSGGSMLSGTILSGATQTVSSGGLASGTVVLYGSAIVLAGGVVSGSKISGTEIISGGRSVAATVGSGGAELLVEGVISVTQSGGADISTVVATASASATTVSSGGILSVGLGGVTTGTVLLGTDHVGLGAEEEIGGGTAGGTVVELGALQSIQSGGASGTLVSSGGSQVISVGSIAVNDVVLAGGIVVDSGALAYTEADGATDSFAGLLSGGGMLVQSGPGTLVLAGTLGAFTGEALISGGTLEFASAGAGGAAAISFAPGTAGTLSIDGVTGAYGTISGFNHGDMIDLAALTFSGTTTPTVNGNTVTITEGTTIETLSIAGAGNDSLVLGYDGAGGTDVEVACYCPGTLILTVHGQILVEQLAIGDHVTTVAGHDEPIRWIGRRSYAWRFLAGKPHLLPVLIRAGALGFGLPRRDLRVSPNHAMLVDGLLIPARQLVNGVSIVQQRDCHHVDYIHIELAEHRVIWAEGAPSETYLDDSNRGMFHNAAEFTRLYGREAKQPRYCAPRVEDGFELEATRMRLNLLVDHSDTRVA